MGEVPPLFAIILAILFWVGFIWYEGGLKGFFESIRDQDREWGLRRTILFLLAFAACAIFITWVTS